MLHKVAMTDQLLHAFDFMPQGICILRQDLVVMFWNRCLEDWTHLPRRQVVGTSLDSFFPHLHSPQYINHLQRVFAGGPPVVFSAQLHQALLPTFFADGHMRLQHTTVTSLPVPQETGHYALLVIQDVTDVAQQLQTVVTLRQRVAEARRERQTLEEQERQGRHLEAIGALASGVAQDFHTLMAAILGYTELALFDVLPHSAVWHNLQAILVAGRHTKTLVQQILTFSRQHKAAWKQVHLATLLQETLQSWRVALPATLDLRVHIDTSTSTVLADPTQLHQVLLHLCANAEQAMRGNEGVLEVCLSQTTVDAAMVAAHPALHVGTYLQLTVRDTGPGIPPAVMARIFEPFFTTKGGHEEAGMGLALVQRIVANHDGLITVSSMVGHGTTFDIYLPQVTPGTDQTSSLATLIPCGRERILLVDDEDIFASLGHDILGRLGYVTVTCTSSYEALATLQEAPHDFDLVVTNHTTTRMADEDFTQELRRIRPDLPIILCTNLSYTMSAEKVRTLGINACLTKPLTTRDLACTIRSVLAQRVA